MNASEQICFRKGLVLTLSPRKTSVKWARLTTATMYHFDDLNRKNNGGLLPTFETFSAISEDARLGGSRAVIMDGGMPSPKNA